MEPLPRRLRAKLIANHHLHRTLGRFDHLVDLYPLARIFVSNTSAYWLLSELDPGDLDFFFGLCVDGRLRPHLGHGRFSSLVAMAERCERRLERDLTFVTTSPLSHHLKLAKAAHAHRPATCSCDPAGN